MKKLTLLLLLISFYSFSQQGRKIVLTTDISQSYLLGSLPKISGGGVFHKLKIEIFGGNWYNSNLGENHYYISTRGGLKINQEVHGGSYSRYELKIYENGYMYDFVLEPTVNYPAVYARSWSIDSYDSDLIENNISDYDPTGKIDVTGNFTINTLFATTNDGNIGIGTTTPDSKLSVNGDIHSKKVKVDMVGWSDFVFKETYNLPTLEEVEKHIQENGHLQDIPSTHDVKENGIYLGEMDAKLLQKIEELTLYTIAQEKKLKNQDKEISKLKEQAEKNKELEARFEKLEKLIK